MIPTVVPAMASQNNLDLVYFGNQRRTGMSLSGVMTSFSRARVNRRQRKREREREGEVEVERVCSSAPL